jgi:2-oxo-4-hydroxy-4-carboxy--5-ureidoimidazoline (OHCU) decarboxylase
MPTSTDVLHTLFEGAPDFVARVERHHAETTGEALFWAEQLAMTMPESDRIELINGHPRIGALPSTVSATSYREQGYDREPGTVELQARLDALNAAYEDRFGFRFVVYVAGRPRAEIADLMESRIAASREEELERALSDVFAIARDRLEKMAPPPQEVVR